MRITRDRTTDTAYIEMLNAPVSKTVKASADVYFDLTEGGELVGVELLAASKYLDRDELTILTPQGALPTPAKPELVFG
jgi:uncharacterized protein YuzE